MLNDTTLLLWLFLDFLSREALAAEPGPVFYTGLKADAIRLKRELDPHSFRQHPKVKLLAAVMEGIKEHIAADPYSSRFALRGPLRRYGRVKGLGPPDRCRLLFRPLEMVGRGDLPHSWVNLQAEIDLG